MNQKTKDLEDLNLELKQLSGILSAIAYSSEGLSDSEMQSAIFGASALLDRIVDDIEALPGDWIGSGVNDTDHV